MDDQKMVRDAVATMLSVLGYECEATHDGAIAVDRYVEARKNGRPFDAVILDLTVPGGLGGADTLSQLLEIDPDVRAIAASGYADDDVMANYLDYGFRAVIAKPFELELLQEVVQQAMAPA